MKNETVYKRFQAVANKRKDAPFLQVLKETALIYNINAVSYTHLRAHET